MLSRENSIKKPADFYKLKKEGTLIKSENFHLKYMPSYQGFKVTIVVSKLVSPLSPKRNRLKRIFKALIKELGFNEKVLLIVYPKLSALNIKYSELKVELDSSLKRIRY